MLFKIYSRQLIPDNSMELMFGDRNTEFNIIGKDLIAEIEKNLFIKSNYIKIIEDFLEEKKDTDRDDDVKIFFIFILTRGKMVIKATENIQEATANIELLSGNRFRIYSVFHAKLKNKIVRRKAYSIFKMNELSKKDIKSYIEQQKWHGCPGSYINIGASINFIQWIRGSLDMVHCIPYRNIDKLLKNISNA